MISSCWWLFLGGGAGVELAELVPLLGLPAGGSFLCPSPRSRPLLLLLFSLGGVRRCCPFIRLWPFCMKGFYTDILKITCFVSCFNV